MQLSENGKALIKGFERCRLEAYQDGGGKWTIGWGHTATAKPGLVWTQEQADKQFEVDSARFAVTVAGLIKVPLPQCRFDALVSLAYNIGTGEDGFAGSTLLRKLNMGLMYEASLQFTEWVIDNGKIVRGLIRRRTREMLLFCQGYG